MTLVILKVSELIFVDYYCLRRLNFSLIVISNVFNVAITYPLGYKHKKTYNRVILYTTAKSKTTEGKANKGKTGMLKSFTNIIHPDRDETYKAFFAQELVFELLFLEMEFW